MDSSPPNAGFISDSRSVIFVVVIMQDLVSGHVCCIVSYLVELVTAVCTTNMMKCHWGR